MSCEGGQYLGIKISEAKASSSFKCLNMRILTYTTPTFTTEVLDLVTYARQFLRTVKGLYSTSLLLLHL